MAPYYRQKEIISNYHVLDCSTGMPSGPLDCSTGMPSGPLDCSTGMPSGPLDCSTGMPSGPLDCSTGVPSGPCVRSKAFTAELEFFVQKLLLTLGPTA